MSASEKVQLEELTEIRSLMEKSSRFLSLSGMTGIFSGIYALIGVSVIYFDDLNRAVGYIDSVNADISGTFQTKKIGFLIVVGLIVLCLSLLTSFYFSRKKARKENVELWNSSAKRMLLNLLVPLLSGGVFCLALFYHGLVGFVPSATLLFYGLALLNASKYTFDDIRYLGYSEIILGLIAVFFIGSGLLFWTIGFGVLHILYGAILYFKYEK